MAFRKKIILAGLCFFLSASSSFGATASKLGLEFSLGPNLFFQDYGGNKQRSVAGSASMGVSVLVKPSLDLALRFRVQTVFKNVAGISSGAELIARYFPFTYARMPTFESEPQKVTYKYVVMPFVFGGIGLDNASFEQKTTGRVLTTVPIVTAGIGTFLPIVQSFALTATAYTSYGYSPKLGGEAAQELLVGMTMGIIFFL